MMMSVISPATPPDTQPYRWLDINFSTNIFFSGITQEHLDGI